MKLGDQEVGNQDVGDKEADNQELCDQEDEINEKKSRIRETKHLSTNADSSTDTKKILLVRQNFYGIAQAGIKCADARTAS